ncbi:MAG: porin [Kluyvera sp.]|uniref:porin n=1 Tax=Kluyvera sp. TaxID=1538228 RepID=UPI003F37AEB0
MLKKTLSITIFLMLISSAKGAELSNTEQSKMNFYGKIKASRNLLAKDNSGDLTYFRTGMKNKTRVNAKIILYSQAEFQFDGSKAEGNSGAPKNRLAFAGLDFGVWGTIDYGRNRGVLYDAGSYTGVLPEFGNDSFQFADNYMNNRTTGVMTYRNNDMPWILKGVCLALQLQGKNEQASRRQISTNGRGYGISLRYALGESGISIGGAASHSATFDDVKDLTVRRNMSSKSAEAWVAGMKYHGRDIYLAFIMSVTRHMTPTGTKEKKFSDKTDSLEAIVKRRFDNGLHVSLGYIEANARIDNQPYRATHYVTTGITYCLSSNLSLDIAYKLNNLRGVVKKLTMNNEDALITSITYRF